MASDAQIAANRNNAQRSTGPRTVAGKLRVSLNALRHGLAALGTVDPGLAGEIEHIAAAVAGLQPSAEKRRRAYAFAQAQLDLWRARTARVGLIDRAAAEQAHLRKTAGAKPGPEPDPAQREAEAIEAALPQLVRLDRYERRALSRRKKAMQAVQELLWNEPKNTVAA